MFKKQCLSVLEILFPRMQTNLSWGTVFSTCKGSCEPTGLCDSRALGGDANILHFSEHFTSLEVSPRSPNGHSLISLLNTSMHLEVNLFFQSPQQQPYSFSFQKASGVSTVCFTWLSFQLLFCQQHLHTGSAIYGASWIFYGDPHLCFGSRVTPWKLALSQLSLPIQYIICTGVFFETTCLKHQIAAYFGVLKNTNISKFMILKRKLFSPSFFFLFFSISMFNRKKKACKGCFHGLSLPIE